MLVIGVDVLVAERRRAQQRLGWHLHEVDPALAVPLGAPDRSIWLDRLGRPVASRQPRCGSPATCWPAAAA